jgi:putative hydrolase of the HAD superfamily
VLFDATGTLLETRESVGAVYSRRATSHGVKLPAWRLDDAFGRVVAGAPARVFTDCHASEITEHEQQWWRAVVRSTFLAADSTVKFADFATFFSELYGYYQTRDAWALRPGVRPALADLKRRGYRTGVVSNFDQRLPIILQALRIHEFLDVVMIPARCRAEKPDPRIFEAALELLGLRAQSVVYLGDDPEKDRAAAERVGMRCIDPDALETFAELHSQIERLNAERESSVAYKAG